MALEQPFAQWLKQRRKALDLTQNDLAERVGCAVVTIQKLEEGRRRPSKQVATLLANQLGIAAAEHPAFLHFARHDLLILDSTPPSPPLPPAAPTIATNLPTPLTALIGRATEVAAITNDLQRPDIRLVTLVGPPGVGKTRLCIRAAEQVTPQFDDGVWFVDLSPLTDAALVLPTIAYVLAIAEAGATSLLERLCAALVDKHLLLILDNCEQVSAAATEIGALLRGCKGLKILATSRVPLLLTGEHEYLVPPLSLPPSDSLTVLAPEQLPATLLTYEAVQLFVARVRQHQHDFAITPANAAQISIICLRLDGIALALELAAAALRRMTPVQLAALFDHGTNWLPELYSPAPDLSPRQRTLTQAIAWSYSLLDANAQTSFRQLGIFVGGFTAAAAQSVCGADPAMLAHLTDHSLLARAPERWQMLAMIGEFALAQISSAERANTQQRHIAYFVAQVGPNLNTVASDHANFRAALGWAIAAQDAHTALTLCIKLCWFWETHGYLREGLTLGRAALALPVAVAVDLRIDALERVATLAWQGHQLAVALQFAEDATTLARRHNRPGHLALTLNLLGRILIEQGDYAQAEATLQESTQLARHATHLFNPGCPLTMLGEIALMRGDLAAAQRHLAQAIPFLAKEPDSFYVAVHVAMAYTNSAELALANGNTNQARHELRLALPKARLYIRRLRCLLVTLAGLLLAITQAQEIIATAQLLGAVAGLGERSGDPLSPLYQTLIAQRSAYAQRLLPPSQWQAAWQVGRTWTVAQAVVIAETWLGLDDEEQDPANRHTASSTT